MVYIFTDQDISFLVPDSCSATGRKHNSIRADFSEDTIQTIKTTLISASFRQFGSCLGFSTLQEKQNLRTLSENF
jgi:hypothetical protein